MQTVTAESAAGILQIGNDRQRVINTINSHILILTSIKTFGILNRQIIQFSKQLLPNQTPPSWGSQFVKVTSRSHKATVSKFIIMFYCVYCIAKARCRSHRYQAPFFTCRYIYLHSMHYTMNFHLAFSFILLELYKTLSIIQKRISRDYQRDYYSI